MADLVHLKAVLEKTFAEIIVACNFRLGEITLVLSKDDLLDVAQLLRDHEAFKFDQLIDVCGVDYLEYGQAEWATESATGTGFDRAVMRDEKLTVHENPHPERYAVVYHLLSVKLNQRLRLKVYLPENDCRVPSVYSIWNCADWFEREAFDLVGILFENHPDLRRILTDYGFIGHPFRKDFPLIGNLEMRYDATEKRVVYEPVSIKPRTLVPRIIRDDSRYLNEDNEQATH